MCFPRYTEDGALVLRSVVSQEWVEKLRDVTEAVMKEKAGTSFDHDKSGKGKRKTV